MIYKRYKNHANKSTIPLSRGQVALVDPSDWDWLTEKPWCASPRNHLYKDQVPVFYALHSGYVKFNVTKQTYMHRAIWEKHNGTIPPKMDVHHINGETLDNRLSNLLCVTRTQNTRVKKGARMVKYKGKTKHLFTWAEELGLPATQVCGRWMMGYRKPKDLFCVTRLRKGRVPMKVRSSDGKVYKNARVAAEAVGVPLANLRTACYLNYKCAGLLWKYVEKK